MLPHNHARAVIVSEPTTPGSLALFKALSMRDPVQLTSMYLHAPPGEVGNEVGNDVSAFATWLDINNNNPVPIARVVLNRDWEPLPSPTPSPLATADLIILVCIHTGDANLLAVKLDRLKKSVLDYRRRHAPMQIEDACPPRFAVVIYRTIWSDLPNAVVVRDETGSSRMREGGDDEFQPCNVYRVWTNTEMIHDEFDQSLRRQLGLL